MNIPVASAHWALSRAEVGARNIDKRFAKRGTSGLITNQRREKVPLLQKQSARDADRFLTFANVNAAGDMSAAIQANEFFLERPRKQHPAKRFQKSLVHRRFRRGGFLRRSFLRFFPALRCLKHRAILRKIDNRAQNFFAWLRDYRRPARRAFSSPFPFSVRANCRCDATVSRCDGCVCSVEGGAVNFMPTSLLTPRSSIVTP